jgi:hypothetical protein
MCHWVLTGAQQSVCDGVGVLVMLFTSLYSLLDLLSPGVLQVQWGAEAMA